MGRGGGQRAAQGFGPVKAVAFSGGKSRRISPHRSMLSPKYGLLICVSRWSHSAPALSNAIGQYATCQVSLP